MKWTWLAVAAMAVACVLLAGALYLYGRESAENADLVQRTEQIAEDNSNLACDISRLVAHVPAVQFEGEPLSNFIGWVSARHDMLVTVRDTGVCSQATVEILAKRVLLDERLLRQLAERAP